VKTLDDSRPVTAAMNDGMFTALNGADAVDLVGFNYKANWYDRYHALHPTGPDQHRGHQRGDDARRMAHRYRAQCAGQL
jgi:hypothetical protein